VNLASRQNLARGKGKTSKPRIYVGCLPCAQARWFADIEHAKRWIEAHWRRCRGPFGSTLRAAEKPAEALGEAA
jgi:hypothetical protein